MRNVRVLFRYKDIVNEAIAASASKPEHCIIFQRRNVEEVALTPGLDLDWDDVIAQAQPHPCVPVEANWPLYILYTSGTTGTSSDPTPTPAQLALFTFSVGSGQDLGLYTNPEQLAESLKTKQAGRSLFLKITVF